MEEETVVEMEFINECLDTFHSRPKEEIIDLYSHNRNQLSDNLRTKILELGEQIEELNKSHGGYPWV